MIPNSSKKVGGSASMVFFPGEGRMKAGARPPKILSPNLPPGDMWGAPQGMEGGLGRRKF